MIPLKLSVRNFLCYRDNVPPLDWRGVHIACLCGDNGHGKSALLDAITWCLWGQARTGSRNYDALIAHGASECRVELDFEAQGQAYRAIRRRRRSGQRQGQSQVDLFALDDADDALAGLDSATARPLTGNTLNETNARIRQIVGLDYETFVNSAFLAQGRSDEFMRKSPGDRKDTLSSILGLDLYERLQGAAREQREQQRAALIRHRDAIAQFQATLDDIPDPTAELAELDARFNELSGQLVDAAADAERMRGAAAQLRAMQAELDAISRRITALTSEIAQADADAVQARRRIADAQALADESDVIIAGVGQLQQARRQLQQQETMRTEYDRMQGRRVALRRTLDQAEAQLNARIDGLSLRIYDELEPLVEQFDLVAQRLDALAQAETESAGAQDALAAQDETMRQLESAIAAGSSALERCVAEGRELRARQQDMQSADAVCPLCGTLLSADTCADIVAHYESEIRQKLREHQDLTASNAAQTQELAQLRADADQRRGELTRRQAGIQRERGRLEQQRQQCEQAQQQLATLRPQLDAAAQSLESGDFAGEERAGLAMLELEIAELAYDDAVRLESFDLTQSLQHWESRQAELNAALAGLPGDEANLQRIADQEARGRADLAESEQRLAEYQAAVADLPELERRTADAEQLVARLQQDIQAAAQRRGALQAAAERRQQAADGIAMLSEQHDKAELELGIYSELFDAFGRSGVPAMLIDGAVPAIETEANLLLGRMTDQRMAVQLETQRTTQSGGIAETLDIFVSDELGTRAYEVFSGGEAFRINLALRIALSKILARRMGAPLPTLFIDEGFGTQDAAGRERIVDTISAIQDQFEKIIIITHLDDLKNLFDVHIQVEKSAAGSQFQLVAN